MKWFRELALVGLILFAAALSSCRSAPTRMYTLRPIPPDKATAAYEGPPIRVNGVHLPAEIDRIQVTTQVSPREFKIHELDDWAAPPGRLARQAFTEDLVARLPPGKVMLPNLLPAPDERTLSVEILEFTAAADGGHLVASWQFAVEGKAAGPASGIVKLQSNCTPGAPAQWADCLSVLLAQLSDRVAADLAARPR
jgi:uncharacterized lipoprotein YmbA